MAQLGYDYYGTLFKTEDYLELNCPDSLSPFWFWQGNSASANLLEKCLRLGTVAWRASPVSEALNGRPKGFY